MPNRIIKESICTSDSVDGLSWFEEVMFYRLIVNCDDYGRFDGRISVIKNRLFPLKDNLTLKSVENAINKLASAGLVALYVFEGKPYLYLPTWNEHQNVRAKRSKYPSPDESVHTSEHICNQMNSDASICSRNPIQSESVSESVSDARDPRAADPLERLCGELRDAVEEWLAYKAEKRQPYKPTGLKSLVTQIEHKAREYGAAAVAAVIRESMSSNYQGIVFDRLGRGKAAVSTRREIQNSAGTVGVHAPTSSDLEQMNRLIAKMGGAGDG